MRVDIAFITASYNTLEYVKQMADFFQRLDAPFTFSFTVVDNNSVDGSQEYLRNEPGIDYIQTGTNLGYGRAINLGVAATESKYVCVTNTDVSLNRDTLVTLWQFLENRVDVGICAPRLTYADGRTQGMLFYASLFSSYATWYGKFRAWRAKRKLEKASEPLNVEGVMGAFFLMRRSVIPGQTLFDEDFFFYHEDTALAHAMKNSGVKCFVLPGVSVVHLGGKSSSEKSIALFYASKYLYLRKFYGPVHASAVRFLDRLRIVRKMYFYRLLDSVGHSEKAKSKRRYYEVAWKSKSLG